MSDVRSCHGSPSNGDFGNRLASQSPITCLPAWRYRPPHPNEKPKFDPLAPPIIEQIDLGDYTRPNVTNLDPNDKKGWDYFNAGLRLMLSYQHELAARCFIACLETSKYCALAHGFVALCHAPNYNFKGEAYYESAHHPEEEDYDDLLCVFPSQQVAERHSKKGVDLIEEIRKLNGGIGKSGKKGKNKKKGSKGNKNKNGNNKSNGIADITGSTPTEEPETVPTPISDVEVQLLLAIRILTCHPGLEHTLSDDIVGRPYADALRKVYEKYPDDPEVAYCFAESLMVLNAWHLYEYPTGTAVSPDVDETRTVLERSLALHKDHAGLCHMYVHLSEMSAHPELALTACEPLRNNFPQAGHLIHMPTHIDVLVGDYEKCVLYNCKAIEADERSMLISPGTAGRESFYFGYIVHNFHMSVYGAILGGFEAKAMALSERLNQALTEEMFEENPDLTAYLEAYSALDVHVLIRFGRWQKILELASPKNQSLMLFRAASIRFGRALAYANMGNIQEAKREVHKFDSLRGDPDAAFRILHNNSVERLLAVDSVMAHGEIAYREGKHEEAFELLRKAVNMQDNLKYDEPWGKMQPIRHALGGLLLEQGHLDESENVFRQDLKLHPRNPWALVGLMAVLRKKATKGKGCCSESSSASDYAQEIAQLDETLKEQRRQKFADVDIKVACACCEEETTE
ncbi:tetratricopeptide repeat protein [Nitzschia inconspicua]|uniref:Tetratricopeptide repeat protein n=1 Tax=Nitzschia inconspicua TaxID=303405 RepID=A0A9K3KUH7_9STRA|nr:tetratricopeptide repeat protein [Nitzschia inconspicua]